MSILYFIFIYILLIILIKQYGISNITRENFSDSPKNESSSKKNESSSKKNESSSKKNESSNKKNEIGKSHDEKEKAYEKNLKEQDKVENAIKKIEKEREKQFEIEYREASKTEKEFTKLKGEIKELRNELNKYKKREKELESSVNIKKNKSESIEKPIIQNSVDKNLIRSNSVKNEKEYVVGCNKDSDCNIFYGDGKNICKSNHMCRCEVGSGELCQYGPTNYKDPKDMTKKEKEIFKHLTNYDNFTIQDYKNWLSLYKRDYYLLSDEHLINLRKILRGEPIRLRDIPNSGIYPPDTSQRYFSEMYDKLTNAEKIVAPINSSTTGNQLGYNYMEYSNFSKPESLSHLRVINGEIERKYRRPSAKNKIWPSPLGNTIIKSSKDTKNESILLEDAIGPYQQNPNI